MGTSITQIAEALADKASPTEIVRAITAQRPIFNIAELLELLNCAKEFQARAEALQRKAAVLMDVVEEVVKASPELAAANNAEPEPPA